MKLAVSSFAWPPRESTRIAAWLGTVPEVGGVELVLLMAFTDPARATAEEIKAVRALYADQGLAIPSVQSLAFGRPELQLLGNADTRRTFRDHLLRMAELASALGARTMVFGSPANRRRGAMPMDEAMSLAVDFFRQLGEALEDTGIILTVEPNPPIYADCDMITRLEEAIELVRRVDHPMVKVQLDTGAIAHAQGEGRGPELAAIADAVMDAAHLHVSVPGLSPLRSRDDVQAAIADKLLKAGLQDRPSIPWATIEMKHAGEEADPRPALREAMDAVCAWYPIAPGT